MKGERWVIYPKNKQYMVSSMGRVMDIDYNGTGQTAIMPSFVDENGFYRVQIGKKAPLLISLYADCYYKEAKPTEPIVVRPQKQTTQAILNVVPKPEIDKKNEPLPKDLKEVFIKDGSAIFEPINRSKVFSYMEKVILGSMLISSSRDSENGEFEIPYKYISEKHNIDERTVDLLERKLLDNGILVVSDKGFKFNFNILAQYIGIVNKVSDFEKIFI